MLFLLSRSFPGIDHFDFPLFCERLSENLPASQDPLPWGQSLLPSWGPWRNWAPRTFGNDSHLWRPVDKGHKPVKGSVVLCFCVSQPIWLKLLQITTITISTVTKEPFPHLITFIPSWQRRLQELNYCFPASPKPRLLCSCHVIKRMCSQQHCLSGTFLWNYKSIKTPHFIIPRSTFDSKWHHCDSSFQPSPVNFSSEYIYVVRVLLHFILSQERSETQSPLLFSLILVFETLCVSPWPGGH